MVETEIMGAEDAFVEDDFGFIPEQFADAMKIDPEALDQECLKQTVMAPQYGFLLAQLTSDRDHLKRRVKVVRASTERAIRSDPDTYGIPKVTEAAVTAVLETHPDVELAEKDLIDKQYEVNMAAVAVDAVSSRKKLLENLIQLWMGSYYSTPKGDMEKMATKSSDEMHRAHLGKKLEARRAAPPKSSEDLNGQGIDGFDAEQVNCVAGDHVIQDCDSSGQGVPDGKEPEEAPRRQTPRRPLTKRGGE